MKRLSIVAVAFVVLLSQALTSPSAMSMSIETTKSFGVIIRLTLNEQGPFCFIVDTGSNVTVVTPGVAKRLNLVASGEVAVGSGTSQIKAPTALVHELRVQNEIYQDHRVVIKSVPEPGVDGVLGQDALGGWNYLIDYKNKVFRVEEDKSISDGLKGQRLETRSKNDELFVSVTFPGDRGQQRDLKVDSGSPVLAFICDSDCPSSSMPLSRANVIAGESQTQLGKVSIRVGSMDFGGLAAVYAHPAQGSGRNGVGLLPTRIFKAVYFNNHDYYLIAVK